MKHLTLTLLTATALLGYRCQNTESPVTSLPPVATTISGVILKPNGISPAGDARVMIRPKHLLVEPPEFGLGKTRSVKDSVQTDENGLFTFTDVLDTGVYLIEAISGNNIVLIDSVEITSADTSISTPPATLKPAGAIKGRVILSGNSNFQDIFVLAYGIDRFTRVKEDGSFCFYNLGEGVYSIRIVTLTGNSGIFDTAGIEVVSADTTDLGAIELPFEGIPVPQNLSVTYDTLLMQVTLHWNKCIDPNVKEYAIYRRLADSNQSFSGPIARQSGDDTVMIDSTAMQYFRYEYRVAAVGSNDADGPKSNSVFVTTASYFTVDTVFNLYEGEFIGQKSWTDIAVSGNGDIYLTDPVNNYVLVFDKNMNFKRRFGEGYLIDPRKIKFDENGLIFVVCNVPDSIILYQGTTTTLKSHSAFYIFDALGAIVDSIIISPLQMNSVYNFDLADSLIFLVGDSGTFMNTIFGIYSYDGAQLRTWRSFSIENYIATIAHGGDNRIYVGAGSTVTIFDTLGNVLSSIPVPGCSGQINKINDIGYDTGREQLYIISSRESFINGTVVRVLDKDNNHIATVYRNGVFLNLSTSTFELSKNGEITIFNFWVDQPGPIQTAHTELIRLNPLNR